MLNSKTGEPGRMGKRGGGNKKKTTKKPPLSIERNAVKDVLAEPQDSLFLCSHRRPFALSCSQGITAPQLIV